MKKTLSAKDQVSEIVRELERRWQDGSYKDPGWTWNRDELHDRPVFR